MRQSSQVFAAAAQTGVVHRQRHDRHIVNAFGFHHRLTGTEIVGEPILMRVDLVVEPQQRFLAWNANFKLHRDDGLTGPRHRINVFDPFDFIQDLFARNGDQLVDLLHIGAGERHHDIGHGDIDLRLFFFRGDDHHQQAGQQADQGQQGRHLRVLTRARNAA